MTVRRSPAQSPTLERGSTGATRHQQDVTRIVGFAPGQTTAIVFAVGIIGGRDAVPIRTPGWANKHSHLRTETPAAMHGALLQVRQQRVLPRPGLFQRCSRRIPDSPSECATDRVIVRRGSELVPIGGRNHLHPVPRAVMRNDVEGIGVLNGCDANLPHLIGTLRAGARYCALTEAPASTRKPRRQ